MADKPKEEARTGFNLVRGVPILSMKKWEPTKELKSHCESLLGIKDGKFTMSDRYSSPDGKR